MQILSEIVKIKASATDEKLNYAVGEGLAPPEYQAKLTSYGKIAAEQLYLLETRYPNLSVMDYIIMPDHIHAIIFLRKNTGGASPSPTLNDVICAYKSLTSRICKKIYGTEKLFQRSFAEHIIRNKDDYETRKKYIYENPTRWHYKYMNSNSKAKENL